MNVTTILPQRQRRGRRNRSQNNNQKQLLLTGSNARALVTVPSTGGANQSLVVSSQLRSNPGQGKSRSARRRRRQRALGSGGNNLNDEGSHYLRSLVDPENYPGAKVPDLVSFPTSTFQMVMDGNISILTGGDAAVCVFNPILGNGSTIAPLWYAQNSTTNGNFGTYVAGSWGSRSAVAAIYESLRPVSAVMIAEFIGNSTADAGVITMGFIPRVPASGPWLNTALQSDIPNVTAAMGEAYSKTLPLRNGARVVWKPMDQEDLIFKSPGGSYDAPPTLYFAVSGAAANTTPIKFRFFVNFEGIPYFNTANFVDVKPSPVNLNALTAAMQWSGQLYNNMSAFVDKVSPFVQPVLRNVGQAASHYLIRQMGNLAINQTPSLGYYN